MKKALALILALVLALSMGISAFAASFVVLEPVEEAEDDVIEIEVVDAENEFFVYTRGTGTYYAALSDEDYENVSLSANGIISAKLVDYDPETMNVTGMEILYSVTRAGVVYESGLDYAAAAANAAAYNEAEKVTYYSVALETNVNIIKITVEDNYSAAYKTGTLKISATLDDEAVSATLTVISDVTIFEYEMVKWAAENYSAGAYLLCGDDGYSDYITDVYGYDLNGNDDYDISELRSAEDAAVISTTAFRAVTGEDLAVVCDGLTVLLFDISSSQKGVNFKHYISGIVDTDSDGYVDAYQFGFFGDQVIAGDYTVSINTGYNWYTLREAFGIKVEEDDIITYYVLKDGSVVKEYVVDYMTADIYEDVVISVSGSNATLGEYEIVLEVPVSETSETEVNPDTGAESVFGLAAAIAAVSLAAAAAVSFKK